MARVVEVRELESYVEAAEDANWRAAMEEEMHALAENETWDLVDALAGVKPIGCKWVYKIKYNSDGSINRFKARLVAKGYAVVVYAVHPLKIMKHDDAYHSLALYMHRAGLIPAPPRSQVVAFFFHS
jgi:hypothetical protein